jgi:hypothetical protein
VNKSEERDVTLLDNIHERESRGREKLLATEHPLGYGEKTLYFKKTLNMIHSIPSRSVIIRVGRAT